MSSELDRQCDVADVEKNADAEVLEQAERVLARHRPEASSVRAKHLEHASAERLLRQKARELRGESNSV